MQSMPDTQSNSTGIRTKSIPTRNRYPNTHKHEMELPAMSEIMDASREQSAGSRPSAANIWTFFRITATNSLTNRDLGRAEGVIRVWFGRKLLHLDSMKLRKETVGMEKSIFGIGLFIGTVAIKHGFECGCSTAELLAINYTDLYHFKILHRIIIILHVKMVEFYTRLGFKKVYEMRGESLEDLSHKMVWGGIGALDWMQIFKN